MKINTDELSGSALDWAVAKCEGVPVDDPAYNWRIGHWVCKYSSEWSAGGPIIEREKIELEIRREIQDSTVWTAFLWRGALRGIDTADGPTPLIAAMRCYVFSKLGNAVEIPEDVI